MSRPPTYLTATEVAEILRCTPTRVAQLCRSGELPATKPAKSWLIEQADLTEFLAINSNRASA